jgi:hypothetical protein
MMQSRVSQDPCDCSLFTFTGIKATTAKELSDKYKSSLGSTSTDTRSAWFSIETLKGFICKIENTNCNNNCNPKLILGIRIYYGRYPDNPSAAPGSWKGSNTDYTTLPDSYANHHTLFMVPTYQDDTNPAINIDFDPVNAGTACKPIPLASLNFDSLQSSALLAPGMGKSLVKNHGDLIPPKKVEGVAF